jgi:hypothetical protein
MNFYSLLSKHLPLAVNLAMVRACAHALVDKVLTLDAPYFQLPTARELAAEEPAVGRPVCALPPAQEHDICHPDVIARLSAVSVVTAGSDQLLREYFQAHIPLMQANAASPFYLDVVAAVMVHGLKNPALFAGMDFGDSLLSSQIFDSRWTVFNCDNFAALSPARTFAVRLILHHSHDFVKLFAKALGESLFLFAEMCERFILQISSLWEILVGDNKLLRILSKSHAVLQDHRLANVALFRLLLAALSPRVQEIAFRDSVFTSRVISSLLDPGECPPMFAKFCEFLAQCGCDVSPAALQVIEHTLNQGCNLLPNPRGLQW